MKNKEAYLKMSRLLEDVAYSCATIELHKLDVDIDYSEKAEEKMSKFREAITECFGIDPAVLARKVLMNELKNDGTETETNCPKD